ncbi:hypothetical protein [Desulfogranum japonicum]|uniref:hypothetical protein n=1 Tax=Desulfogranum japonicum TaxID=231447 RepID=UPI0003F9C422|nr:hypothetical protein [Desulfogranum japonicum]
MRQHINKWLKKYLYIFVYTFLFVFSSYDYLLSKEESILTEKCYIDNNYVLLYKIINWWNDSSSDEDNIVCGDTLRYVVTGVSIIHYDNKKELLTISTNSYLEDLVSLFKECRECEGPSYFKCSYINEKYFGKTQIENALDVHGTINAVRFKSITNKQAQFLIENEKYIAITLEGVVGGLILENGKIALHHSGNFLKSCPQSRKGSVKKYRTTLTIKNYLTNDILATYDIISE